MSSVVGCLGRRVCEWLSHPLLQHTIQCTHLHTNPNSMHIVNPNPNATSALKRLDPRKIRRGEGLEMEKDAGNWVVRGWR